MIVLGFDGALRGTFSAAIARDGQVVAQRELSGNVALEHGLELVAACMHDAGVASGQVDHIAVGQGPGGFTGLRIAIAYAKSLAQAWAIPLAGISSFDLLEFGLDLPRCLTVVVGRPGVLSVRYRGESPQPVRASGPTAEVVTRLSAIAGIDRPVPIVGAPEDVLAAFAEGGIIVNPYLPASVSPAAAAALLAPRVELPVSLHAVRPDYGELPAAKVPSRR